MLAILLQATPQGNNWFQFIPLVGILIVFYFLIYRPQQKRQKEQQEFKNSLKVGDKVVTIGGLHGKVVELREDIVIIDADRGTRLTFERTAISAESTRKIAQTETKKTEYEAKKSD
jgi:preprotein translocase subunit YajC